MGNETDITHDEDVAQPCSPQRQPQPKFLGQTKAEWYIYWICAVASIANMYVSLELFSLRDWTATDRFLAASRASTRESTPSSSLTGISLNISMCRGPGLGWWLVWVSEDL